MEGCRFCGSKYQKERNVISNEHFFANFDDNPVTRGHMKIIPKRHADSFFDMSDAEVMAAFGILRECRGCWKRDPIRMPIISASMTAMRQARRYPICIST